MMTEGDKGRVAAQDGIDAAVAEYIRTRGITRCPTACAVPTQGTVADTDRAALAEYATARDRSRQAKAVARARSPWVAGPAPAEDE